MAGGHVHSLIPGFAPHPRAWLRALRELRHNQKPPHKAKPKSTHRHATKRHATKRASRSAKPKRQAARAAPSAASPAGDDALDLRAQRAAEDPLRARAATAARRHESGIVILDFGKPSFHHGGYGTLLFSGRFAPNRKITSAMLGYAHGYVSCLPKGSTASIELARGTSNYHPSVPSAYTAGVRWARETNRLGRKLARKGLDEHVEAAAADDAEPAWDPAFRKTRQFFHGFRAAVHGHTLFDYGSLDGGVGAVWSARQAWYVAGGLPQYESAARDLQLRDGAAVGRARADRARPLRTATSTSRAS